MTTLDERHGEGAQDGDRPRGEVLLGLVDAHAPATVPLDRPAAAVPGSAGSKAANLARAAGAGLPVLPGFVIPYRGGTDPVALRHAWHDLSDGGARPLVVRSSSPQEDTEESSLAGQFASVLDVRGWHAFRTAVRTVLDSAVRPDGSTAPMAVLVQPMLTARVGGVMFGADPVEGRTDRMLVSAVRGGPDSLVSGEQAGTNYWLSGRGRLLRTEAAEGGSPLTRSELARLARLARRARRIFGGPQDLEFGFDGEGRLWLFQSRPITAMAVRPPHGARLLGPGPVAETLPEQLVPLEEDLWVAPMARGLAAALDIAGSAPRRLLRTVPVVRTVGGRAAADLRLLGAAPPRHRWLALLNPAPGARRLGAAWRVGRLSAALPGLATDLAADVDRHLAEIPPPSTLPASALVAEIRWTRRTLASLHAQEALAGALLREPPKSRTAAGTALAALETARARGVPDDQAVAAAPVILALTAPSLRGPGRLPGPGGGGTEQGIPGSRAADAEESVASGTGASRRVPQPLLPGRGSTGRDDGTGTAAPRDGTAMGPHPTATASTPGTTPATARESAHRVPTTGDTATVAAATATATATGAPTTNASPTPSPPPLTASLPPREALRLRIRWVQELQVRLVRDAGRRVQLDVEQVGQLRWRELAGVLHGAALPVDLAARVPDGESPPLPDAFRLTEGGVVVAERDGGGRDGMRGVSGGRAVGTVWDGAGLRPEDAVLVVRTLDPALAPLLPGLTGLVAQTGSPLSHLAVLAREFEVPAVVGAADAVHRFPVGSRLTVDGTVGDVQPGDAP
ncbi:PEP/pyruvate-binding domain-containing protein [Streptomyces sp. S.PB5]|uniref:PEP/pyruvate-binding domain-containing protein n=1 Tax=Streptomyces sp. S.PB5 TaxID=3020844 RepID=UPI0025B20EFA|nr:PEP/pyruvate-binding domain-containing protein [Streptomyces sp. S.PB5]MDN3020996.1 PEP/pyruvate-binding domain-containing protein [Streptomyces sp. S.PB5]